MVLRLSNIMAVVPMEIRNLAVNIFFGNFFVYFIIVYGHVTHIFPTSVTSIATIEELNLYIRIDTADDNNSKKNEKMNL